MRIGLDLDGVVVDSIGQWIRVLNRELGTSYHPGDLPSSHGTPDHSAASDRCEVEMLIVPGPVPGAPGAVARLRDAGHSLTVITARHPRLRGLTEAWLLYHALEVDELHFLEGASKAPVAVAEGIDLMVEDTPHHAMALAEAGVPVLLMGWPYNLECRHPLIRRCESWEDVLEHIAAWPETSEMTAS